MVRNRAAPLLPVFKNSVRYGTSGSNEARGPMQKSMAMTVTTAMAEFATYDHHMVCGTIRDASLTSSAAPTSQSRPFCARRSNSQICTMVSEPSIDQMMDTWVSRQAMP